MLLLNDKQQFQPECNFQTETQIGNHYTETHAYCYTSALDWSKKNLK